MYWVGVGVLLQNISREFYRLCAVCLALIGQKYSRLLIGYFHAPSDPNFCITYTSQRSERTKNIGWGWEGFVACEGNQVKVGRRDAKHRAKEGCDADIGLYFVTLSSR